MRIKQHIFSIVLALILILTGGMKARAMDIGFSTEPLDEDTVGIVLENICIAVLPVEPPKTAIDCFAVNEDGTVAIGCSNSESKTVSVYSSEGVFQYGFRFKCSGSFGVGLGKNTLSIYLVRSDVAISISPNGEVNEILKIQDTPQNNDYWNNCVFTNMQVANDTEYTLENNIGVLGVFASSHSRLIATNKNGIANVIYDASSNQLQHVITAFVLSLLFVFVAVIFFIYRRTSTD